MSEKTEETSERTQPTAYDHEIAKTRRAIADTQRAAYTEVLMWGMGAFGPGFLPSGRHFLVSKEAEERHRRTGEKTEAAATVYTVRHQDGRKRHFTVDEQGKVTECENYEAGFGSMLLEPDPMRTIEVRGQKVAPHRFSLCWAPFPLYEPKTADELAVLRESRIRKKAEREQKKWVQDHPLLAWAGLDSKDEDHAPETKVER